MEMGGGYLNGNTSTLWVLVKTILLIISMVTSYFLASKIDKEKKA
jgi:uncharacterized protein (UPF0333 family)